MSTTVITPSLLTLPVELLHRIFDDLDVQTIVLSLRLVCRQIKTITNTYNRYAWNFKSVTKSVFHVICRVIHPQNVISLTLSDDDETPGQIELFLSFFRIRRFNRLRSSTLLAIKQNHLNIILKSVSNIPLRSLRIHTGEFDRRRKNTTATLLSSAIAQSNIRELILDIIYQEIDKILWSDHCTVQYLRLHGWIKFDELCTILRVSSCLRTLVLKDIQIPMISLPSIYIRFPQLVSLILEDFSMEIDELEMLLSLTPSLTYLKLIGKGNFFDGNRWEQFIQVNLPRLNKFEFFFSDSDVVAQNPDDIQAIVALFRTPFWLEHKRCFVTCEHCIGNRFEKRLYSIPICKTFLKYESESKKISCSTFITATDNYASTMDNVEKISVDLTNITTADIESKIEQPSSHLFRKVTHLELDVRGEWHCDAIQFLSTLIDLSRIVQITLYDLHSSCSETLKADIANVFNKACNISSVELRLYWSCTRRIIISDYINLLVPSRVKHLRLQMSRANEIENLLKQLENFKNLSSMKFDVERYRFQTEIIEWLTQKKNNSTYQKHSYCLKVWIGTNIIDSNEAESVCKRMKMS